MNRNSEQLPARLNSQTGHGISQVLYYMIGTKNYAIGITLLNEEIYSGKFCQVPLRKGSQNSPTLNLLLFLINYTFIISISIGFMYRKWKKGSMNEIRILLTFQTKPKTFQTINSQRVPYKYNICNKSQILPECVKHQRPVIVILGSEVILLLKFCYTIEK